jgi:hypothetical protein
MFPKPLQYTPYLDNPWVISTANEIARHRSRKDKRTKEEKFQDALNGCAIQLAVFDFLKESGVDVRHAPDNRKEYDLIIILNGKTFYVDVKGIFKPNAKYFCQTEWEKHNVPMLGHPVHYICFDCKSGVAHYAGWCLDKHFKNSHYNDGTYAPHHFISRLPLN